MVFPFDGDETPSSEPMLRFRASLTTPTGASPAPLAETKPLPAEEARALLARLPDLPVPEELPPHPRAPLPPPTTGAVRVVLRPEVPLTPPAVETPPLRVLRLEPQGTVAEPSVVRITFSQPMIAVSSAAPLEQSPVRLTPPVPGNWRWIGTQVLVFEPAEPFPYATTFHVEVPAGLTSASGATLSEASQASFTIAFPQLTAWDVSYSIGAKPVDRHPFFWAAFERPVMPPDALGKLRLLEVDEKNEATDRRVPVRLATEDEVASYRASLSQDLELPRNGIGFRSVAPLPPGQKLLATFSDEERPAVPHHHYEPWSEGRFAFDGHDKWSAVLQVLPAFALEEPLRSANVQRIILDFTNPIDEASLRVEQLQIVPQVERLQAHASEDQLILLGEFQTGTYQITLPAELRDVYGQVLGRKLEETVTLTPFKSVNLYLPLAHQTLVIDPTQAARVPVFTHGLERFTVRVSRVTPEDWPLYMAEERPAQIGTRLWEKAIEVSHPELERATTWIDLASALTNGRGHVLVQVSAPWPGAEKRKKLTSAVWVQATQLGLSTLDDREQLVVAARDLRTGEPLAEVSVRVPTLSQETTTDATGLARFRIETTLGRQIIAESGLDCAFVSLGRHYEWRTDERQEARWFVIDERGLYRPGETVRLKGWVRLIANGPVGELELPPCPAFVKYEIRMRSSAKTTGRVRLNGHGGFEISYHIPENSQDDCLLITYSLVPGSEDDRRRGETTILVVSYRRQEFEVSTRASAAACVVGDPLELSASARYFTGGALSDAPVRWTFFTEPAMFHPPSFPAFSFGPSHWYDGSTQSDQTVDGCTQPDGTCAIRFEALSQPRPHPVTVIAETRIQDLNAQEQSGVVEFLVHPASEYVGLHSLRWFATCGEDAELDCIVVSTEGQPVTDREILLRVKRLEWVPARRGWERKEFPCGEHRLCSAEQPVRCAVPISEAGEYCVTARIQDPEGRTHESSLTLHAFSRDNVIRRRPLGRREEGLSLRAERTEYHVGERARIAVNAPWYPAQGQLTIEGAGILRTELVTLHRPDELLTISLGGEHCPTCAVRLQLFRGVEQGGASYVTGSVKLEVSPDVHRLAVSVRPENIELQPGEESSVAIRVTDRDGAPLAGAEVAILMVDEALLALSGNDVTDPILTMYSHRSSRVRGTSLWDAIFKPPVDDDELDRGVAGSAARACRETPAGYGAPPIALRQNFNPVALFVPGAITDRDGRVTVEFKLPDTLTRYRISVVAVHAAARFGWAEDSLVARRPFMLRPTPPRFALKGDRFEVPVLVENQTPSPLQVKLATRGAQLLLEPLGQTVEVPAHSRAGVLFIAMATAAGQAILQVAAAAADVADAVQQEIPVYAPATAGVTATYGELEAGAVQLAIETPPQVTPEEGGVEVSLSSTALSGLLDGARYVLRYPHNCGEQLASRLLVLAAFREALPLPRSRELPGLGAMNELAESNLKKLATLEQGGRGVYAFWKRGAVSPYLSLHVAHALHWLSKAHFQVPERMLESSRRYVQDQLKANVASLNERSLAAFALYVGQLYGVKNGQLEAAARLAPSDWPDEALPWLWPIASLVPGLAKQKAELRHRLLNHVRETASEARIELEAGAATGPLGSLTRATAITLEALLRTDPNHELLPKLARGLLASRHQGRWHNTHENALVLLALTRYLRLREGTEPQFTARVWLDGLQLGEQRFESRTQDTFLLSRPMAELVQESQHEVIVGHEGTGRLHYRVGLRWVSLRREQPPVSQGFTVDRLYLPVDRYDDVRREADGTWRIRGRARVRVQLGLLAPEPRSYTVLIDPLPAGFEPLFSRNTGGWWRWFEHENQRDEQLEIFATHVSRGQHSHDRIVRATTRGRFVASPARAEEMYTPETFGRSGSDRVVIE